MHEGDGVSGQPSSTGGVTPSSRGPGGRARLRAAGVIELAQHRIQRRGDCAGIVVGAGESRAAIDLAEVVPALTNMPLTSGPLPVVLPAMMLLMMGTLPALTR